MLTCQTLCWACLILRSAVLNVTLSQRSHPSQSTCLCCPAPSQQHVRPPKKLDAAHTHSGSLLVATLRNSHSLEGLMQSVMHGCGNPMLKMSEQAATQDCGWSQRQVLFFRDCASMLMQPVMVMWRFLGGLTGLRACSYGSPAPWRSPYPPPPGTA